MLNELDYPKTLEYSSDGTNLPIEFFMLTVPLCKRIDLKLGYFSSNAIRTLAYGFAQFIHNGGYLRIITNHYLSYQDKMMLVQDEEENNIVAEEEIKNLIENDLEGLAEILKNGDQHFFNCLKFLLKKDRLEIIPVKLKPDKLAHYKQGIMDDGTNQVYFNGSCNFTYKGLVDNGESLGIARSWGEESEKLKIQENILSIDRICKKEDESFEYLSANQITEVIFANGQDKDLDELIDDEFNICDQLSKHSKLSRSLKNYIRVFRQKIEFERQKKREESQKPRFPYPEGPREYQKEAYEKWVANNYKGIFAMATGTGKTITSLSCLLNLYEQNKQYKAIIIVPTIALLTQWKKECEKFNFKNIITISFKDNWNDKLSFFNTATKIIDISFIVIVTYASLCRPKFQSHFNQLPKETVFIADEVHNIGSTNILKLLPKIHLEKRIGLSATPNRQFDILGNSSIEAFFNDKAPYLFSFSMKQALEIGWLCKYTYIPHIVFLTDIEFEEYVEISLQLMKYFDGKTGKYKECKEVERLLLERKRIIHKASNKKNIFKSIIANEFSKRRNLKYTLVYVPEGLEADYSKIDEYIENEDELSLINEYTRIVKNTDDSIMVNQYTSKTKGRDIIISDFEKGNIHVLTSMKCLDEGVDVPRSELAIFCSSTGNPRQFIQRRGRVLRNHKDKIHAVIHDLVVVPKINSEDKNYEMERNLFKNELIRVVDFSELSINKMDTYIILKECLDYYNLNLNDLQDE